MPASRKRSKGRKANVKSKASKNVIDESLLDFDQNLSFPFQRKIAAIEPVIIVPPDSTKVLHGATVDFTLANDQWYLFTDSTKFFLNISLKKGTVKSDGSIDKWENANVEDLPKILLYQNFISKMFSSVQFIRNMVSTLYDLSSRERKFHVYF